VNPINETANTYNGSATTEEKAGRRRRTKGNQGGASTMTDVAASGEAANRSASSADNQPATQGAKTMHQERSTSSLLNPRTHAKFVLFGIPRADQVDKGPVMRGFIEVKTDDEAAPVKVNVAAWLKIGRTSGTEYLSLKVGNNNPQEPTDYSVGPFYGRLFRQVEGTRTRYFGFIEDSEKTGEDENGQGTYETHWQIRISAKPALSNDQKTRYISGQVTPSQQQEESAGESQLPF
jgi:hypothetical protein